MYFRQRPPDRQPLAFEENSRTNLEVQRPFGEDMTFQEYRKSWKLKNTIFWNQIGRARVPKSCAPLFRSFLSCQNPLNCHMGQQNKIGEAPMNSNWNSNSLTLRTALCFLTPLASLTQLFDSTVWPNFMRSPTSHPTLSFIADLANPTKIPKQTRI